MSSGPVIGIRDDVVAVGIGSGIRLRLNELAAEAAVNQLLVHGRLTLPNTTEVTYGLDGPSPLARLLAGPLVIKTISTG